MLPTGIGKPDHVLPDRPEVLIGHALHLQVGERHVSDLASFPDLARVRNDNA
jgi:hypothetical protein